VPAEPRCRPVKTCAGINIASSDGEYSFLLSTWRDLSLLRLSDRSGPRQAVLKRISILRPGSIRGNESRCLRKRWRYLSRLAANTTCVTRGHAAARTEQVVPITPFCHHSVNPGTAGHAHQCLHPRFTVHTRRRPLGSATWRHHHCRPLGSAIARWPFRPGHSKDRSDRPA
jgi:hypothetical protein